MADQVPWEELFEAAFAVRPRAHAPYSNFKVGAAALFEDGTVVSGCNVENASFGLTLCAERNAIAAALSGGHRQLKAIAIVGDSPRPVPPCGMCRQVMAEFGSPDTPVHLRNLQGEERQYTLKDLLPHAFTPSYL